MIFLLLLVGFCYVLHNMCQEKGVSPFNYLAGFVAGFFLILFATSAAIVLVYGQNIINDPDMAKKILVFTPFTMMFHFLLFVFFRRKIAHLPDYHDEDDDSKMPPDSREGKDFSYFR